LPIGGRDASLAAADIRINARAAQLYVIGGGDDQVNVADTWVPMATGQTNPNLPGFTFNQYHSNTTNSDCSSPFDPDPITAVANTHPPSTWMASSTTSRTAPRRDRPHHHHHRYHRHPPPECDRRDHRRFCSGQDVLGFVNAPRVGVFAGNTLTLTGHACRSMRRR
jgi:hypothetical protein